MFISCVVFVETTVKQIEDAFKEFTSREDIAIVLISQYVSYFIICIPGLLHDYEKWPRLLCIYILV